MDNRFRLRAWDMNTESMKAVGMLDYTDQTVKLCDKDDGLYWADNPSIILMQCTGLVADKSYRGYTEEDRLIWEGDICSAHYSDGRYVGQLVYEWNEEAGKVTPAKGLEHKGYAFFDYTEGRLQLVIKILGNIHEHPELLEESE